MKKPSRSAKHTNWVILAWALNAVGVIALVAVFAVYISRQPVAEAKAPEAHTQSVRPTLTPAPTSFYLPTITPNPLATEIEDYSTPTPFVLANGPAPIVIGHSVLGRPIDVYAFGQGEIKYLIVSGIHGGYEGNTVDLANQLIAYLTEHSNFVPGGATLYIVRDMNPDAEARGRNADARVNAHGVDLNRNFPTNNWMPNWDHSNCWNDRPTTGGDYGGSEPETRTVMNFVLGRHIQAMISYHSAALGVFPGGAPVQQASKDLARKLSQVTGYPYPPVDTGCVYTGTLADWAVENGVGAAVDMELSNHQDSELNKNLRALRVLLAFSE